MFDRFSSHSRREFLRQSLSYFSVLLAAPYVHSTGVEKGAKPFNFTSTLMDLGPLQYADENGCCLPKGFSSRIIARSGERVASSSVYKWHWAPDGGACFPMKDGGWAYVSNSEVSYFGGCSAIRFDASGEIINAYNILSGTSRNCAGGATPYGTWLSCEEDGDDGRVFECDPSGQQSAIERPALGYFNHEAIAYDTHQHILYLTEDKPDGGFYRFIPSKLNKNGFADLSSGQLQIMQMGADNQIHWHAIPDPQAKETPTRHQVKNSTPFNGGEGIAYYKGKVAFTTKGDNRVWVYEPEKNVLTVLYDQATSSNGILSGVDNMTVNFAGDYLVAEDGGDMQIVILNQQGQLAPLLSIEGHYDSEITGPAFSPDGKHLYFSSQRGTSGHLNDGVTFQISGPFFRT